MDRNFRTPSGLKIRLDCRYFYLQLTNDFSKFDEKEMLENYTFYNIIGNIESMFLIPITLIQIFSLISVFLKFDIATFLIGMTALYVFGWIYKCTQPFVLLNIVLNIATTTYKKLWWAVYIVLIAFTFINNTLYLIVPYICLRLAFFIIGLLFNRIVLTVTHNKFGVPFNDTEICAFRVFQTMLGSDLKLSKYIEDYVSAVCVEH